MKRVLVTPLDWGLGHASRCIPIILALLDRKCEVIVAGSGDSLKLLKAEFPSLAFFSIEGYSPSYPRSRSSMVWKMVTQIPKFLSVIHKEHGTIEKIVKEEKIDLVISDNRYGCWSSEVPCVFITHQSNIMMPERFGWLQEFVRHRNEQYMKKFTRCWIPDFPDEKSLAGELISFGKINPLLNVDHIGPLSRFRSLSVPAAKQYDVVAVFSGPEPQRTMLETKVLPQLKASGLKYFAVRGKFSAPSTKADPDVVDYLTSRDLQKVVESAAVIIARSGYSTIMDLAALKSKAIFIPTPGQTEQEYLSQRLMDKGIAFSMKQEAFNLKHAMEETKKYSGFKEMATDQALLTKALDDVLNPGNV